MRRDAKLAYMWHSVEVLLVVLTLGWALIGWFWSWQHRNPLVEAKPR